MACGMARVLASRARPATRSPADRSPCPRRLPPQWSNTGACVDLFAPGVDVFSACGGPSRCELVDDRSYSYASGTSMAVPLVAGALGCGCWAAVAGKQEGQPAMRRSMRWSRRPAPSSPHRARAAPEMNHAGVAAAYLGDHPTATPHEVATAIVGAATQNKLASSRFRAGTPNKLLYSRLEGAQVQAASGP